MSSSVKNGSSPKIAIIGAGTAGISAALKLTGNGVQDVIVLEAQDYIGGRVKSVLIDGNPADLGAQFIHGRVGNPLYDIVSKLKRIPAHSSINSREENLCNPSQLFCMSSGNRIDTDEVQILVDVLEQVEIDACDPLSQKVNAENETVYQDAVDKVYQDFLLERGNQIDSEKKEIFDAVVRWFCKYIQIDNASEDLTQLRQYTNYIVLKGDRFTDVEQSMASVLATMADQLPHGVVRLNMPVTGIQWQKKAKGDASHPVSVTCADGSVVSVDHVSHPVTVTCADGSVVSVDHVIVTPSLGCLKATHHDLFDPPLPECSRLAILNSGFGSIGKIYLLFREEFWDSESDFESFEFLWLESHVPVIKSDKCHKKTKNGKPWWYGLHSCETVHALPKVLEMWLSHEQLEVYEQLSDQEVMDVTTEILQVFLPHLTITDPVAVYRTSWLSNPYTRGTYSYDSCRMSQQDRDNLGKPLPSNQDPQILFAGEAYSPHFHSTVHGALSSGDSTADAVLKHHGISSTLPLIDLIPS